MSERHRRYTEDELAFLRDAIPGHLWREVSEAFERRFGRGLTRQQVDWARRRLGVRTWPDGECHTTRGRTWGELGVSAEQGERRLEAMDRNAQKFEVGHRPPNALAYRVGDERTDSKGYAMVKVCESYLDGPGRKTGRVADRIWRMKHHLVWEQAHGRPFPEGHVAVFADHDKANFAPENIFAVPKGVAATMDACGMKYYDAESLRACIAMANIRMALNRKKREVTR